MDEEARVVFCPVAGCGARLKSLEEFEDHYNARHTACCSEKCLNRYKNVQSVESETLKYECLVEGCGLKFKSYKGRKRHLVDKHKFPKLFEFLKKSHPSKKQRQKNQRKPTNHTEDAANKMEVENAPIDGLVSAVSKLSTSPSSISFGRHHTPGLTFVPRVITVAKSKILLHLRRKPRYTFLSLLHLKLHSLNFFKYRGERVHAEYSKLLGVYKTF